MNITFTDPIYLFLVFLVPLFIVTHFYSLKYVKKRALRFANFEALKRVSGGEKVYINWTVLIIRLVITLLLIASAAGMTFWHLGRATLSNYVIAIDASGSMLADDFKPNRFEAAKESAAYFVEKLTANSKIGVVSFSGISEIESRMTSDLKDVSDAIKAINIKEIHGTAIGSAIETSINLFSEQGPNAIILVTDGRENVASERDFDNMLEIAKKNEIIIHTIGVGTEEGGLIPGLEVISTVDEDLMNRISSSTGGRFFRASSDSELEEAFAIISSSKESNIPTNLRLPLMLTATFLLLVEWGLINTKYKSIP